MQVLSIGYSGYNGAAGLFVDASTYPVGDMQELVRTAVGEPILFGGQRIWTTARNLQILDEWLSQQVIEPRLEIYADRRARPLWD